jgi:hypothetical protein
MTYRDDLEASAARAASLAQELEQQKAENERLRRALDPAEELKRRAAAGRASVNRGRQTRATVEESQSRLWLGRGALTTGYLTTGRFYVLAVSTTAFLALFTPVPDKTWKIAVPVEITVAVVVFAVLFVVFGVKATQAAERELAWAASLPFPLEGFPAMFANPPGVLNVNVTFQGDHPDEQTVRELFHTVEKEYSSTSGEKGYKLTFNMHRSTGRSQFRAARALNLHLHKLVDEVLLPLHRAHPLQAVRFGK